MEREAQRPTPNEKTDAELDAELERLSQEAQAKLAAESEEAEKRDAERAKAYKQSQAELAKAMGKTALETEDEDEDGSSLATKLFLGAMALVALFVLWGLVIKPLLGLALVVGVIALLGFGVVKVFELGKDPAESPPDDK